MATLSYINAAFQNPALSITSLDLELEKAMATHSSTLAWKIPWTEVDRGAWKAVVHGVAKSQTRLSDFTFTFMHWRRKWQPTSVFFLENPRDSRAWWAAVYGVAESDKTKVT